MKTRLVVLGMALGLVGGAVLAQEGPPGFGALAQYRFGTGARALGLGSAFTAVATGAEGLYWNPAGLAWATLNVGGMYTEPFAGLGGGTLDYRIQYLGAVGTVREIGLGGGWFSARVGGIPSTEEGGTFDYDASVFLAGGALRIPAGDAATVAVGLTAKLYRERMLEGRAQGMGFDAGVVVDLGTLRLAYCSQDVGGTRYQWRGTGQEPEVNIPWLHRIGAAASWLEGSILTTADAVLESGASPSFRLGVEWTLLDTLALRGGVRLEPVPTQGYRPVFTAGLGVAWSAFALDAAYLRSPVATVEGGLSTDTFVFSVGLRF